MKEVYRAANPVQAAIVQALLAGHGIETVVFGDLAWGGIGELPVDIYPRVMLLEEFQFDQARELVATFEQPAPTHGPVWRCECGEQHAAQFSHCWRCEGLAKDD